MVGGKRRIKVRREECDNDRKQGSDQEWNEGKKGKNGKKNKRRIARGKRKTVKGRGGKNE